jgi:hypothetical protein
MHNKNFKLNHKMINIIETEVINECIKNGEVSQNINNFNRFFKPIPEEHYITSGVPYRTLNHYFNDFKAIVFIGYSFGLQKKTIQLMTKSHLIS